MSSVAAVDVLVPSLDRPEELQRALASIETVREAEPEIEIRVQRVDRSGGAADGPAAARNRAAASGEAEFIALLDDDDQWLAPRLSQAVSLLRAKKHIALVAGNARLTSGGSFLPSPPAEGGEGYDHGALALNCWICSSTVTLRRTDWEEAGGMCEELDRAEDYDLWLRLTSGGRRAHLLPDFLAVYDDQGGGLSADPVAMARATLAALERSARMPERDPRWRDRLGRLQAVVSHGLARQGQFGEARELAVQALAGAPTARVAWTSLIRATLQLRR
ncbi:MAG: glycosyltransferase [Myxococcota bacterium]|nr:glycosyltransferase [Myxococcota bacterium]